MTRRGGGRAEGRVDGERRNAKDEEKEASKH
jgi:hypothetical protein